jgi:Transcriptional regulator
MKRTKEEAAETRQTILAAAERLFLEEGYENVTLDQIAVSAEVTRGAVHWHFKNKQGLLTALSDNAQAPFRKLAETFADGTVSDPLDGLSKVVRDFLGKLHADPRQRGMIRVAMHHDLTGTEAPSAQGGFREQLSNNLAQILLVQERLHPLPAPWTVHAAAAALTAALVGLVSEWALEKNDFDLVPHGASAIEAILRSFRD